MTGGRGGRVGVRVEEHELTRHPRLCAAVVEAEARGRSTRGPRPLPGAPPVATCSSDLVNASKPDLEGAFLTQLRRVASYLPAPERQYLFANTPSDVLPRPRGW